MSLWQISVRSNNSIRALQSVELEPNVARLCGQIELIELTGSGVGDQYIFQGEMDLGDGPGNVYNVAMYSDFQSERPGWSVVNIGHSRESQVPEHVRKNGVELARMLIATIDEEFFDSQGFRHSHAWLQTAWEQANSENNYDRMKRFFK